MMFWVKHSTQVHPPTHTHTHCAQLSHRGVIVAEKMLMKVMF